MAMDRQGAGLAIIRMSIGVFFIFEGLGKWRWLTDSSILANQLAGWQHAVAPGSPSAVYLERVAIPFVGVFARLVPLAELCSGIALVVGFWTPFVAPDFPDREIAGAWPRQRRRADQDTRD